MTTLLILTPVLGSIVLMLLPRSAARPAALGFSGLAAVLLFRLWQAFDPGNGGLQCVERHEWIPAIGAEYLVGVDGLSLLMLLLTTLLIPFALLAQPASRGFCSLMLLLQGALYGTFTAQNFVPWFLFYEGTLIPAFLLIRLWGGENRDRAGTKFFVYTFLGGIGMLLAFLMIYLRTGTFDFATLAKLGATGIPGPYTGLLMAGVFLGLAVKVPLFPFHTWLPDAYASAPTAGSMVLTGLLSKMGVYGVLRLLLPVFPHELKAAAPCLIGLAVCSILFASLAAWAQKDLKRMVAYLSINHLGYCMLAVFVAVAGAADTSAIQSALGGVLTQMFNHGLTAAALFYFVGLLEQRAGTRGIGDFGGLMQRTPALCTWMGVAMFSSLGLPGLNGFVGEFLIFKGSFALAPLPTAIASLGLLFTAVVFLRAIQALFSGPLADRCSQFADLTASERLVAIPAGLLMLALGVAPQILLNLFNATVTHMSRFFAS